MSDKIISLRPIVTEKSSLAQSQGLYTFIVDRSATKIEVKRAVKELYGVEVKDVKIMIMPRKIRIIGKGNKLVKRDHVKKAIVSLKDKKKSIDPTKFKETKN